MLYDSKKDAKFVDESLRSSSFRTLQKGDLFDVFDEDIMAAVNDPKQNPIAATKTFTLVRSDISEIKYPVGGFFSKHKDYLSITSNSISEFTMIVGLTGPDSSPPTVGGETLLHSAGHTLSSTKTTTPGGGLLFRKDIEHEGAKLEAGSKRILTVNLWAIDKAPNAGEGGVLLIEFPDSSPPASPTSSSNTNKRKLRELGASYIVWICGCHPALHLLTQPTLQPKRRPPRATQSPSTRSYQDRERIPSSADSSAFR